MNIKSTYFGFTNNLKPVQKGKIEKTLDKLFNCDGIIMTEKEWIYNKLKEGYKPQIEQFHKYNKKTGATTLKDEYVLMLNNRYYIINKTSYQFALYLIENDFLSEQKANDFITLEQTRIKEKQEKEKEELRKREQEENEFKIWLQTESEKYNNKKHIEIAKQIFINQLGKYNESYILTLLVLIENIENPKCREKLKDYLHRHNKASKKIFSVITGIKLPQTDKGTFQIIDMIMKKDFQQTI